MAAKGERYVPCVSTVQFCILPERPRLRVHDSCRFVCCLGPFAVAPVDQSASCSVSCALLARLWKPLVLPRRLWQAAVDSLCEETCLPLMSLLNDRLHTGRVHPPLNPPTCGNTSVMLLASLVAAWPSSLHTQCLGSVVCTQRMWHTLIGAHF